MKKIVRIGTRESALAVAQAQIVAAAIRKNSPEIEIELVKIKTTGDKILDKMPDKIGGKGVFVKELNESLRRGAVDICVHSAKDVPHDDDDELPIVALGPREDARDVLVLSGDADCNDKPIGCSSQRRQVQLRELFPLKEVAPVRGNILTRLAKLDSGEFSALVLAAAGLRRLGLWERAARAFSIEEMLPAACQGVLAVQGRRGEDYAYLSEYDDADSRAAVTAERAFTRRLGFGCGAPAGAFARLDGETLRLCGMLGVNGVRKDEIFGLRTEAAALGVRLAEKMLTEGGI